MYRVWNFLTSYSLLLVLGALLALVWANVAGTSYHHLVEYPLWFNDTIGVPVTDWLVSMGPAAPAGDLGDFQRVVTLHFLVNDFLMAFFFAIAGKEVWEAVILERGELRGAKAATPLVATAGGMLGPVAVYLGLAFFVWPATFHDVAHGWAIPTATDIAFCYLVGRVVFGAGHPAIRFLLLLAIADDAGGLLILAVFYPTGELAPLWLLLSAAAAGGVFVLANWLPRRLDRHDQLRRHSTWVRRRLGFWPYALAGAISWYAFARSGIHPALGLLPIVPTLPHADRAFGIFAEAESYLTDLLNSVQRGLQAPVEVILFLFGLMNAGVVLSAISEPTWLVLLGLLIGKPVGILLFGWAAVRLMGLKLPSGMTMTDLLVLGCVAAIGFTVALFVASVAFESGPVQDAAKMGALLSFGGAAISILAGRLMRVQKVA